MRPLSASTHLAITNPLVLYRSLLATKQIEPDPAQHRFAIHLQRVHERLRDYYPEIDFRERLQHVRSLIGNASPQVATAASQRDDVNLAKSGLWSSWRNRSRNLEATALTRSLTDQSSAAELNSPQGLLLHGEVGTGKSLLLELLGECLPSDRVQRWHYNTFMLSVYAKIEKLRMSNSASGHDEYALLRLSRDLVFKSPILFIDEFQFPDRASSKILSNLLTSFFHLGGVLIATSNRMPEQLADAAGFDFKAHSPPHCRQHDAVSALESAQHSGRRTLAGGDFGDFLKLLKARCETWNIEGSTDWRRRDVEHAQSDPEHRNPDLAITNGLPGLKGLEIGNLDLGFEQGRRAYSGAATSLHSKDLTTPPVPPYYFIKKAEGGADGQQKQDWIQCEERAVSQTNGETNTTIPWRPDTISIYGRSVAIPRQFNGVTKWTFGELCAAYLGSADYVSLASSFHTFIIVDVPVLTLLHKNEGRRFITLLDALYEARCKLLVSCWDSPDHIFFPERLSEGTNKQGLDGAATDSVYSETFSEIHQDQTLPFRPNITAYSPSASQPDYPTSPIQMGRAQFLAVRSILADEDSDFGPVYGAGRHQSQQIEQRETLKEVQKSAVGPNFSRIETFTGQDEMFAYKRAESRLWEMCSERWWSKGVESWRPLAKDARHWENGGLKSSVEPNAAISDALHEPGMDDAIFSHGASPFRRSESPPPRFNWTHAWGMALWGKKAGPWGQGPQGLNDRKKSNG